MGTQQGRNPFTQVSRLCVLKDGHSVAIVGHILTCLCKRFIFLITALTVFLDGLTESLTVYLVLFLLPDTCLLGFTGFLLLALGGFYLGLPAG